MFYRVAAISKTRLEEASPPPTPSPHPPQDRGEALSLHAGPGEACLAQAVRANGLPSGCSGDCSIRKG